MRVTFKKDVIALEQLHCAIELFLEQRFIPAITLAGAAEELYGKAITLRGRRNAQSIVWDFVSLWNPTKKTARQVCDAGNRIRNGLKHGTQESIEFDPKLEAFLLITRAIENYLHFGKTRSDLMRQFREATKNIG